MMIIEVKTSSGLWAELRDSDRTHSVIKGVFSRFKDCREVLVVVDGGVYQYRQREPVYEYRHDLTGDSGPWSPAPDGAGVPDVLKQDAVDNVLIRYRDGSRIEWRKK